MPQIHITDLSQDTYERLKQRAEQNGHSLSYEVKQIIEHAVPRQMTPEEFRKCAAEWRMRNGPQTTDSVDLIREDRER